MCHLALARVSVLSVLLVLSFGAHVVEGQGTGAARQKDRLDEYWADFNHYVRIAHPELARDSATALMKMADDDQLLAVVESGDYPKWQRQIDRALKMDVLRDEAQQLGARIQQAKVKHSRDPRRIRADVLKLAEGARARLNATARLRAAGQFAAPHLLATLQDDTQRQMHPFVMAAMVAIGRPMVHPLSIAVPRLEPVTMGQVVQVLAEIEYTKVLPFLKQILESETVDPNARIIVQSAFDQLAYASALPANVTAAELYLILAQNLYAAHTRGQVLPGHDPVSGNGIVWEYSNDAGLVAVPVPGSIYGDVLAMRASELALQLNPQLDPALSLWLMSNLRRENSLSDGATDPSYGYGNQPTYYLRAAGPLRQHDVLDQGLKDGDPDLALDAIAALDATAGTDALVNREGTAQPLLRALSHPDRRVRFRAAEALTNARPKEAFPGSHRVVPVLAEAIRQSDVKYAVILAQDQAALNSHMADLKDLGYQPFGGLSIEDITQQVSGGPGVDLIVVSHLSAAEVEAFHGEAERDHNLAVAPIVAIVSADDQLELNRKFGGTRLIAIDASEGDEGLNSAIDEVQRNYERDISAPEGEAFALTALGLLREVAVGRYDVFNVADAKSALLEALNDQRQPIAKQAGNVLALIDDVEAQRAIAGGALDETRSSDLRVSLLGSLAESATSYGNYLGAAQIETLLALVKSSEGDLAVEAGRAHGALTLPTDHVVQMITAR